MENNKINIAELLKDVSLGTIFWSNICGPCTIQKVGNLIVNGFQIMTGGNDVMLRFKSFHKGRPIDQEQDLLTDEYGRMDPNGECIVWPSKDHRTWEDFKLHKEHKEHKEFEPFEKVLVEVGGHWSAGLYSCWDGKECLHHLASPYINVGDTSVIPYKGNENLLGKEVKDGAQN